MFLSTQRIKVDVMIKMKMRNVRTSHCEVLPHTQPMREDDVKDTAVVVVVVLILMLTLNNEDKEEELTRLTRAQQPGWSVFATRFLKSFPFIFASSKYVFYIGT